MRFQKPWFEREEELFQQEKVALEELGFRLDEKIFDKKKTVVFDGEVEVEGDTYPLHLEYPAGYPLMMPTMKSTHIFYNEHQNVQSGDLCLIHQEEGISGTDLVQRTKWLIEHIVKGVPIPEVTDPAPLQYNNSGAVLMVAPIFEGVAEGDSGIGTIHFNPYFNRGVLTSIEDKKWGLKKINKRYKGFASIIGANQQAPILWVAVSERPPLFKNIEEFWRWLITQPGCEKLAYKAPRNENYGSIVGINYPDGGKRSWLFVGFNSKLYKNKEGNCIDPLFYQSQYIARNNMFRRVRDLKVLQDKSVVIVGLGAIGANIPIELAKAGIKEFTVIDPDVVTVGNLVRHIAYVTEVGLPKTHVVKNHLYAKFPDVNVTPKELRIGYCTQEELEWFIERVKEADIIVEATADISTMKLMNRIAIEFNKPLIGVYSAAGIMAGRVYRLMPHQSACYQCFEKYFEEGKVKSLPEDERIPAEVEDGCNQPSVPGAGFDSAQISIIATRLVVQTLLKGEKSNYGDADFDQIVFYNRDVEKDNIKAYSSEVQNLPPHPECECCSQ